MYSDKPMRGEATLRLSDTPLLDMDFPKRLTHLRKQKGFTQKTLAEAIQASAIQIHRYETGAAQPTLDVIRRLAVALGTTADELIFDQDERGPDEELKLQFETISRFDPEAKAFIREVLDSLILKQEAKRWLSPSS